MPESFWLCLEAAYASVDGSRADEAEALDHLESEFRAFGYERRCSVFEQLNVVVAQLSRLSMRIKDVEK